MENAEAIVPVHLLSGFLGSGKTTLLSRVLEHYKAGEKKAAVIMNELGDVNLDGYMVRDEVPMAEMLGGCICCTIRGDLSMEIKTLLDLHQPDVILIESTGAANPIDIIDGVTEAALYVKIDLRTITTVVDGPGLIEQSKRGKGRSYKLMQDQIRCATHLIINKADKLAPEELVQVQSLLHEWNPYAPAAAAVRCEVGLGMFDQDAADRKPAVHPVHSNHADSGDSFRAEPDSGGHHHASHDHVMAVTHYFRQPIDSKAFEAFLAGLPGEVYRAKGILTFTDTASKFLFQYAYREMDFMKITPQSPVNDVAVFIGEHFSREQLLRDLELLEQ